ncbi:MAG: hypothetical protein QXN71_02300 [Candidatus Aenigmatarchaeota archaeon]
MAEISSINVKNNNFLVTMKLSKEEYEFLKQETAGLMVIPVCSKFLSQLMTTGKLGNSNRLMLPKKSLDRLQVKKIRRKVPGRIFKLDGSVYLIARLSGKVMGIPEFGGEEDE